MEPVEVFADFYSPRWGHTDRYTFSFSMEQLSIKHGARECVAIWSETTDPTWKGESLVGTMRNDHITPPDGIEGLIEHLWREWRGGRFNAVELQNELTAFTDYINASTAAKPKTDFWKDTF